MNYYLTALTESELYHHGVKGMKWGVRRKDKSVEKTKSKAQLKLESRYRNRGLSEKEAEKTAAKRMKTLKLVAAAAGVSVAAAGVYAANKKFRAQTDSIIRKGKILQRIEMKDTGGELNDHFYAVVNRADKRKYAGRLAWSRYTQTGHAYMHKIRVDKNIKVADTKKATEVFEKLYNNDADFKKVNTLFGNRGKDNVGVMYERFNKHLAGKNSSDPTVKKFYNALKSEGYGAIIDTNDIKPTRYNAKRPLIIFDHKGKVSTKSFREMSVKEIEKYKKRYLIEERIKKYLKKK